MKVNLIRALGPGVFGGRLTDIDVFMSLLNPLSRAIGSQVAELQVAALVFGAHTCVYRDSHRIVLRLVSGNS